MLAGLRMDGATKERRKRIKRLRSVISAGARAVWPVRPGVRDRTTRCRRCRHVAEGPRRALRGRCKREQAHGPLRPLPAPSGREGCLECSGGSTPSGKHYQLDILIITPIPGTRHPRSASASCPVPDGAAAALAPRRPALAAPALGARGDTVDSHVARRPWALRPLSGRPSAEREMGSVTAPAGARVSAPRRRAATGPTQTGPEKGGGWKLGAGGLATDAGGH